MQIKETDEYIIKRFKKTAGFSKLFPITIGMTKSPLTHAIKKVEHKLIKKENYVLNIQ